MASFRLGRMAQVGFRLECLDSALEARVAPPVGYSPEERLTIEREVNSLRLDTDVFYHGEPIRVRMEEPPRHPVVLRL